MTGQLKNKTFHIIPRYVMYQNNSNVVPSFFLKATGQKLRTIHLSKNFFGVENATFINFQKGSFSKLTIAETKYLRTLLLYISYRIATIYRCNSKSTTKGFQGIPTTLKDMIG